MRIITAAEGIKYNKKTSQEKDRCTAGIVRGGNETKRSIERPDR
jgi:hypothetical protein